MSGVDFAAILAGIAESGASQADIARQLHVAPSTVCRIASGEIRQPCFETGSRILSLQAKSLIPLLRTRNTNWDK